MIETFSFGEMSADTSSLFYLNVSSCLFRGSIFALLQKKVYLRMFLGLISD